MDLYQKKRFSPRYSLQGLIHYKTPHYMGSSTVPPSLSRHLEVETLRCAWTRWRIKTPLVPLPKMCTTFVPLAPPGIFETLPCAWTEERITYSDLGGSVKCCIFGIVTDVWKRMIVRGTSEDTSEFELNFDDVIKF